MQVSLTEKETDILKRLYYNGEYLTDIAKRYKVSYSYIQQQKSTALIKMRRSQPKKLLQSFIQELISAKAYTGTGLNTFRNNTYSSVEFLTELKERLTARTKQ